MGLGGFFKGLGKAALKVAPYAAMAIPGIGPGVGLALKAGLGAANGAMGGGGLKGALVGGGLGAAGAKIPGLGGGLSPSSGGFGGMMKNMAGGFMQNAMQGQNQPPQAMDENPMNMGEVQPNSGIAPSGNMMQRFQQMRRKPPMQMNQAY